MTLAITSQDNVAAAAPTICTTELTIFTTSTGTVTNSGYITQFRNSGVAGQYTSGFLAGYTLSGAQDITLNNATKQSTLQGHYTLTGSGGTLNFRYSGSVDLNNGAAVGRFYTVGGTGQFANFFWAGSIAAQLTSQTPPTFHSRNTGICQYGA